MGAMTPIGIGRAAFWQALRNGDSGVRTIEGFDISESPVKIAAQVRGFDWEAQLIPKDRKHVPRTVPLALAAAREALEDANYLTNDLSLKTPAQWVGPGNSGGCLAFTEQQYEYVRWPHLQSERYTIPASTHGGLPVSSRWVGAARLSHVFLLVHELDDARLMRPTHRAGSPGCDAQRWCRCADGAGNSGGLQFDDGTDQ